VGAKLVYPTLGLVSGFLCSFVLSALFLSWPIRFLLLAILLGLASVADMTREQSPRRGWALAATRFTLGYALFAALLVGLEILFPPLT
jgi:hypothetical protein